MSMARLLARDRATLSRFRLNRKSMCRGRYSWLERQWHASRETMDQPDGSMVFSAETAGIHDIRIRVLSWGANARVPAPESLEKMITSEIA